MSTIRTRGRRSAILPTLIVVAVLVVAFAIFTNFWTDRLWYTSFNYGNVFTTLLLVRLGLFVAFGLLMGVIVAASAVVAHRLNANRGRAGGARNAMLDRYRDLLDARFRLIVIALSVVVGLFAGGAAAGQAQTYLAWRNSTPFGKTDPVFNLDISFFVFDYPWWRFALSFLFAAFCFAAIAAAVVHYVSGALRFSGPGRGGSRSAQAQLSVLVGLAVLTKGASYWFDRYGLAVTDTPLITGINYTAATATINAKTILAIIAVICALLFFANAVLRRWVVPTIGLTLMLLSAILLGVVYPGAVQQFSVRPDEPDKERPYIERNIAATRDAYGVAGVQVTPYTAETNTSAGQLTTDAEALPGIRLIDPTRISPAYEQLQQVKGFYQFPKTLDVDRYTINNAETDAIVAVREMDQSVIPAQNWNNLKTVYTHGYGLVAAYGNRRASDGSPQFISGTGALRETQPRIYYGELQTDYSIVGAPAGVGPYEWDNPNSETPGQYTYTGKGGVSIGNLFNRALYAAKFGDVNILLSDRVNDASKIIYDRNPRERVMKAAPWLTVDGNIYPAVVDGRVVWIVDGYTTSNTYPYSKRIGLEDATADTQTSVQGNNVVAQVDTNINYIRNSVKAVVDAYDGTVSLYEWDKTDPVLQTWKKAFPGTVQPREAISASLLSHMRYPQDLFKVQRNILARYHMTDPGDWYRNAQLWEIPNDPTVPNNAQKESPYYLSIKWPKDESAVFSLTSVYVPNGRQNISAYMAVNADAASDKYGQLRILQMSETNQIDGPGQTANALVTNPTVAEALRPFQQGAGQLSYGNLLTLPLGGGLLYVQPVYTQRQGSSGSYPTLRFVMVRFGQSVGIGGTLQEALDQAFSGDAGANTGENPGGTGSNTGGANSGNNPTVTQALAQAQAAFTAADRALANKDLATYQAQMKLAQAAVQRAQQAAGG